ncbi:hypothetical protein AMPC_13180 [Anaeromyxobacter paludicola]|uniref:MlaB-like STAS domain-containing protein n=2 Tax=Anaeromyxobacter paludicola TaxID=2918171 RepID=A0ABM7X8N9_9BACT|nr:hypothetical protein AMPC_13180 [Anaeromyxobacter paludicola]
MADTIRTERRDGIVLLRLRCQTFDASAAASLIEALRRSERLPLLVDFSAVRDFDDHSVARFCAAARAHAGPIRFHGLREHQVRMLRYLGLDPARARA